MRLAALATLTMVLFSGPVLAQSTPAEKDLKLMTKYFKSFVYELERPVLMYNWSQGGLKLKSASDPIGVKMVVNGAKSYWRSQNNVDNDDNMYGFGLYAALDPVATRSYGEFEGNWVLLEMKLPQGFRTLDLGRDGNNAFPQRIQKILTDAKCPSRWADATSMFDSLMQPKSPKVETECMNLIRAVFQQNLAIDGFLYNYNSSEFAECVDPRLKALNANASDEWGNSNHQRAIRSRAAVITDSKWVKPELIRIYTPTTSDAKDERLRITSLFYKTEIDVALSTAHTVMGYQNWVQSWVSQNLKGFEAMIEWDQCGNFQPDRGCLDPVKVCQRDEKTYKIIESTCKTISPPPIPVFATTVIRKTTFSGGAWDEDKKSLLWPEFEGSLVDANVGQMIRENFLGCSEGEPYRSLLMKESK